MSESDFSLDVEESTTPNPDPADPLATHEAALTVLEDDYDNAGMQTRLPLKGLIGFLGSIRRRKPRLAENLAALESEIQELEMTFSVPENAQERIAKYKQDEQEFEEMRPMFRETQEELNAHLTSIEQSMPENERSSFPAAVTIMREANNAAAAEIDALLVALVEKNAKLRAGLEELVWMWSKSEDEDQDKGSQGSVSGKVGEKADDEGSTSSEVERVDEPPQAEWGFWGIVKTAQSFTTNLLWEKTV
ncbi:hypothetical protein VTJ49DRAFT_1708 [Mycothermus thermophilus]|uniref:Uncharacterized protein n=1 Tax=Humicola insolens TaxID=85995 RepID=A0ABR3VC72_HUMIN